MPFLARCLFYLGRMQIGVFSIRLPADTKSLLMKNLVLYLSALLLSTSGVFAKTASEDKTFETRTYRYNDSFIFVEDGVTFSVYPDGEFDFYIDNYVSGRRNGVTFNSGYDYSPYAQYDDYGAVIQVENVPIFYDYYGRVAQIGNVDINYRRNRVRRVGGMVVFYNNRGFYDYHTGFINVYNRHYVYRPFHAFFARPAVGFCLVYNRPYRRFYSPVRYTYYSPYQYNTRRAYAKVGRTHRYNQVRQDRARIYRNDRRVAVRDNATRSSRSVGRTASSATRGASRTAVNRTDGVRRTSRETVSRNGASRTTRTQTASRSGSGRTVGNQATTRSGASRATNDRNSQTVRRSSATQPQSRSKVTRRTVSETPRSRTVTKSGNRFTGRTVSSSSSSQRNVSKAPSRKYSNASSGRTARTASNRTGSSRNLGQASSRSRSSVGTRSTPSRNTAKSSSARSSRSSNGSRTASTRSARRY